MRVVNAPQQADLVRQNGRHHTRKNGVIAHAAHHQHFQAEHRAFEQVQQPLALIELNNSRTFTTLFVLDMFYLANPGFPAGSFSLSCKNGHVTAVEACFSKSLQPMRCQGLKSCDEQVVAFDPLPVPAT